jgi:hypothetical protein
MDITTGGRGNVQANEQSIFLLTSAIFRVSMSSNDYKFRKRFI